MLRSALSASRLLAPRPLIHPSNPQQALACTRQGAAAHTRFGCRSMAVAASASSSDGPLITPGTPISTPTLVDIDKRWLDLTAQQQLDIFKALHDREKEPWYTMTTEERKACKDPIFRQTMYYINFGPHGPRAEKIKDGWQILGGLVTCMTISFTLFWALRQFITPPPPRTMTREWQEATNERLKELGIEPISGPGSENYKGSGVIYGDFVNRKSRAVEHKDEEDDE